MKGYEIVFILDPNTSEDGQKQILDKVKTVLAGNGGEVLHEASWGRRKLAYPVSKREYGIYHLLFTNHAPAALKEAESQFRFSEDVLKWMSVSVEDVDKEFTDFERLKAEGSLSRQIADRGR
jgi:small subunit ribosomal protein S6